MENKVKRQKNLKKKREQISKEINEKN